jgi:hypothetical protein
MRCIPLAVPIAWTKPEWFFLHSPNFGFEIGSDCPRRRRHIR